MKESSTLLPVEIPLGKNSGQQSFQPSSPSSRLQNTIILTMQTWARIKHLSSTPRTPAAISELSVLSFEELAINLVENSVVFLELPGKRAVAQNHAPIIFESEGPRVLLRRIVPGDVVEIMVNCSVLVVFRIAYKCLKVSLRRWDKVGVVEEKGPWQIVPPHYGILGKRSWQYCPSWTCIELESCWNGPLFNNPPNLRLIAAIQCWVYYNRLPSLIHFPSQVTAVLYEIQISRQLREGIY